MIGWSLLHRVFGPVKRFDHCRRVLICYRYSSKFWKSAKQLNHLLEILSIVKNHKKVFSICSSVGVLECVYIVCFLWVLLLLFLCFVFRCDWFFVYMSSFYYLFIYWGMG